MAQKTAAQVANEQARKDIYAQGELMRQQALTTQGEHYTPDNYTAGVNSGGGVFSFGQDFGSPYRTNTLEDLKQAVPTFSPVEFGDAEALKPLEGIQEVSTLTQQYYDNIDKLNMLGNTAASQGWNITEANVGDPNKREMSNYYQTLKAQTLDLGNTLKRGAEFETQGTKDNFKLEHQGEVSNRLGVPVGRTATAGDVVDFNQLDTTVAEVNETARRYENSGDKATADKFLNERRKYFRDEAARLKSKGQDRLAEVYENAAISVGIADKGLEEEKYAFERMKHKYGQRKDTAKGIKLANDVRVAFDPAKYKHTDKGFITTELAGDVYDDRFGVLDYIEMVGAGEFVAHYVPYTKGGKTYGKDGGTSEVIESYQNFLNKAAKGIYGNKAPEVMNSLSILQGEMNEELGYGIFDDEGDLDSHFTSGTLYDPNYVNENINAEKSKFNQAVYKLGSKFSGKNGVNLSTDDPTKTGYTVPFTGGKKAWQDRRNKIMMDWIKAKEEGKSLDELNNIINEQGDMKGSVMNIGLSNEDYIGTDLQGYDNVFLVGSTDSSGGVHVVGYNSNGEGDPTYEKINIGTKEQGEGYDAKYVIDYLEEKGLSNKLPEVSSVMEKENKSLSSNIRDIISSTEKAFGRPLTKIEEEEIKKNNPESAKQKTYQVGWGTKDIQEGKPRQNFRTFQTKK